MSASGDQAGKQPAAGKDRKNDLEFLKILSTIVTTVSKGSNKLGSKQKNYAAWKNLIPCCN